MDQDIHVVCVPPDLIGEMWPHVGPLLLKGQVAAAGITVGDALINLTECIRAWQDGRLQLWAVLDDAPQKVVAAMVSEILLDDDGAKVVWVTGLGGDGITRWGRQLSDDMAAFARSEGCSAFRFKSRKAALRTYRDVSCIGASEQDGVHLFERKVS